MNWNKELDKIADKLKGEKHADISVSSKNNASIRSNDANSVHNRFNQKQIEKGVNRMITVEAAIGDLDKIAKSEVDATTKIIEAFKVLIKMLSTVRSNQLLCEEDKVKIREAKAKRNQDKEVK